MTSTSRRWPWANPLNGMAHRPPGPLRQLLYVEWVLLGIALFLTLPSFFLMPENSGVWLELFATALLGGVGLVAVVGQPQGHWPRVAHTALELGLLAGLLGGLLLVASPLSALMRILPLLGLVVVVRSCQRFNAWGQALVVALVFGLHSVVAVAHGATPPPPELLLQLGSPPEQWRLNMLQTTAMIVFALVLVFVSLLVNALLSIYHSQQQLAAAHGQLRRYAARVEDQATLQERNRIAREIHDSLGHALTAQTILLENALLYLPPQADQAREYLIDAKESAYQALRDVSKSVSALRNSPLQGQSLATAIPQLVDDLCRSAQLRSHCAIDLIHPLPDETTLALFRIVQEALTNAVKHSQATAVTVKLGTHRHRLHLQVIDNGQGFDPSKNTSGFGLRGMRERATALGGTCQLWSAPGSGCHINLTLPLPPALDHSTQSP